MYETITDHLPSRCRILAKKEYLIIHDIHGAHLHYSIRKALGIETTEKLQTQIEASM